LVSYEVHWKYNGQNKKDKRTKNDLQNIALKTKYLRTRTPQKPGMKSCTPLKVSNFWSTCLTHRVDLATKPVINLIVPKFDVHILHFTMYTGAEGIRKRSKKVYKQFPLMGLKTLFMLSDSLSHLKYVL
jgi:hypothetical protein